MTLFYFAVIGRGVDVGDHVFQRRERGHLRLVQLPHVEDRIEFGQHEAAAVDRLTHRGTRRSLVAGQERLGPARGANPRRIGPDGERGEAFQHGLVEKRHIARDDEHALGRRRFERRIQPAHRASPRDEVRVDGQTEIGEAIGVGRDNADRARDPLQDLQLPYDDGTAPDDEPALVLTAEPAGGSAREDGGAERRVGHEGIMPEARVGRLLAACLHQGVLDVLPQRLDYYEEWLRPDGLRDGRIGLAPITAVVGFLRTEGDGYDRVMVRAGALAADWTVDSLPAVRRRVLVAMPRWLRARLAARVAASIVRDVFSTSTASARVKGGQIRFDVRGSLFCAVRDRQAFPLCAFYRAVAARTLDRCGLPSTARIERCGAVTGGSCVIVIDLDDANRAVDPARAA